MDTSAPLPDFPFDRYIRYDELTRLLQELAAVRPELVRLESIGKSYEGRDIWAATVTNFASGPDTEKPAVYADGNLHASEVSSTFPCGMRRLPQVEKNTTTIPVGQWDGTASWRVIPLPDQPSRRRIHLCPDTAWPVSIGRRTK